MSYISKHKSVVNYNTVVITSLELYIFDFIFPFMGFVFVLQYFFQTQKAPRIKTS